MNKNVKKPRRVETRRVMEGQLAAKRQRFYETGAPAFILMMLVFVILASFILSSGGLPAAAIESGYRQQIRPMLVDAALLLIMSIPLGLYIAAFKPRIVKNHLRGGVLLGVLLLMFAMIRLGVLNHFSPYLLVVPVMITGIMISIAYTQRFSLGISSFLVLIGILALSDRPISFQEGLGVLLATGSGTVIAVLSLREIRTRSKLIEVSALAAIVVFIMIVILGLWQDSLWGEIIVNGAWGAGGSLAVGFLMQGLLPVVEKVFRTATSMTLLDYGEATKPLLKRLAVEAPGTFNHSWQIGMLAEAAAEAIGVNGLLCRVGSYYHDVGKINKPRYFVENQVESVNLHKELSPTMSRMIIVGHVKDGLELIREYKIPKVLHQFVSTHHGTTLVEYFYHEAAKKESETDLSAMELEFRYPGPKPASKEAAIVMLADAVEGATRAMQEPTPNRIETVVHNMAMKRLLDGQFDECDLTMQELHVIEGSLVKSLCGMYHARIVYPQQEKLLKSRAKVI